LFAARFYELNERLGGLFSGGEFARHTCDVYTPLATHYRGYTIYETAPVSQGFILLEELNILSQVDLPRLDPLGPESIHLMVEAVKLSFADRNQYAGDPAATGFDVKKLLTPSWAEARYKEIDPGAARQAKDLLAPSPVGDTTAFVAVDGAGNACTFIHSNAFAFGSGLMVPGTGVLLNNRAGRSFNLVPGHPNCLAPGKRPLHTLNCYLVFHGDDLFLVGGTPGGDGQPQWNLQILSLILDHGASPQEAVDFPRWLSFPGTDVQHLDKPYELQLEDRFPTDTLAALSARGHRVRRLGTWEGGGGAQVIMLDPATGLLAGASDRRVEGLALGF
ncbi:MAG TPA: gamma-glutamyltransferase, partial [Firmicutes bacterium]|nr:gamma-glutamyltransferase [Bacillota bacterium]